MHSARCAHAVPRNANHNRHLQNKLKQIRPQHAPQPAERNVNSRERHQKENANRQRLGIAHSERCADDVHHRLCDPAEDQAVHQQPEIHGAKTAQECRRFARVAEFRKLHVGDQAGAPPHSREQEDRHHSRRKKTPPQPIPCHSLRVNQSGHGERSIGGKSRRHHRRSRQPPGNVAADTK